MVGVPFFKKVYQTIFIIVRNVQSLLG